jgi:hypothetical protein
MTPFIKLIINSLTFTHRTIRIDSNRKWLHKNIAKYFIATKYQINQQKHLSTRFKPYKDPRYSYYYDKFSAVPILFGVSFPFFGFLEKKEKESELITTIKKSILLIQV